MTVISQYALVSLNDTKQHLGIGQAELTYDDLITRFINTATTRIETYCDRRFKIREYTDIQAYNKCILLNNYPADNPSAVFSLDCSGNETAITDYELDKATNGSGVGITINECIGGVSKIKVVYNAGFDIIPSDLEDAAIWSVEFLYDMRNDRRIGMASKGKNSETTNYNQDLPKFVLDILNKYKRNEFIYA